MLPLDVALWLVVLLLVLLLTFPLVALRLVVLFLVLLFVTFPDVALRLGVALPLVALLTVPRWLAVLLAVASGRYALTVLLLTTVPLPELERLLLVSRRRTVAVLPVVER